MLGNFSDNTTTSILQATSLHQVDLGLAIGLPCAIALLFLVVVFVYKKKQSKQLKKELPRIKSFSSDYASVGPPLPERPIHQQPKVQLLSFTSSGPISSTNRRNQNQLFLDTIESKVREKNFELITQDSSLVPSSQQFHRNVETVNTENECINPSPDSLQDSNELQETKYVNTAPADPYLILEDPSKTLNELQETDHIKPNQDDPYLDFDNPIKRTAEMKPLPVDPPSPTPTIILVGLREPPSPSAVDMYPCLSPVNGNMKELNSRLQTFSGQMSWPQYKINATIQEFVMAGLYYLGSADKTSCWYCGGTLENWDKEDIPWEEHARWYPRCEYLLRCKGSDYVKKVQEKFK